MFEPFYLLLVVALLFDFLNGFHDSSNIVATVISSRALHPRVALLLAALAEFVGPFIFGVAVATTIGNELLMESALNINVIIAALVSAVVWNLLTWYAGIPSSSSHALLGGLLGAAILSTGGFEIVKLPGLLKIVLALLLSPIAGLAVGFIVMRLTLWLVRNASPRIDVVFKKAQVLTLIGLALSHGTNDAQKTMGVIALGLFLSGRTAQFFIPLWVIAVSAGAIAVGTAFGGWRLIRTLGGKIFRIRPIHGFTSQIAGAGVILGASLLGGPVSTTQVMSSSIMGVGAAQRVNMVRWNVLRDMVTAWLLTIPLTAGMAALVLLLIKYVIKL
ncbi:MAG: inorganic phosphate transporter [Anaerolineales bacterium]|nr:inorganic phosphate transporter [Anaerolineales bacterium]